MWLYRQNNGSKLINDLVGTGRFRRNLRIQPDQRLLHHGFHHDIRVHTRKFLSGNVCPAISFQNGNQHLFHRIIFIEKSFHIIFSLITLLFAVSTIFPHPPGKIHTVVSPLE